MSLAEYRPDQVIRDAAKHGELVVFVGAGASMLCGSPDWRGFANQVVTSLENQGALSFLEAEQLRAMGDARRTLSIAMGMAREKRIKIDVDRILHPEKARDAGKVLYDLLVGLRPVFVTTNYDKWLDEAGPDEASAEKPPDDAAASPPPAARRPWYHLRGQLTPDRLTERGAVIHLHGSYTDQDSMVVSLRDYIEHYADETVRQFLSEMFKNYTVLFVGYGLAELEVLEHIVRSNTVVKGQNPESRHFLLYAHRSTEVVQTDFMDRYFREQCGIQVIRYCIDSKGFSEVLDVFKAWSSELDVRDPTTLDLQATLDRCVAEPTPTRRESALRIVEKHPELSAYLINALTDAVWFADLDRGGFFDAQNSPALKAVKTDSGLAFQAEGWPALRYLERVAGALSGGHANRAAQIVREVTADAENRNMENWRTSWSLAAVVAQLPTELILRSDIEMMRKWLVGRFDTGMVGRELGTRLLPRLLGSAAAEDVEKALLLMDILTALRPKESA